MSSFSGRDRVITIKGPGDLKGYRIGVITDDAGIKQLLDVGWTEANWYSTQMYPYSLENYPWRDRPLVLSEAVGHTSPTRNRLLLQDCVTMQNIDFYYAFSKDIPDST